MGTNECSQPASKSSWDSQDIGDSIMVFKMAHCRKAIGPRWVYQYFNDISWYVNMFAVSSPHPKRYFSLSVDAAMTTDSDFKLI